MIVVHFPAMWDNSRITAGIPRGLGFYITDSSLRCMSKETLLLVQCLNKQTLNNAAGEKLFLYLNYILVWVRQDKDFLSKHDYSASYFWLFTWSCKLVFLRDEFLHIETIFKYNVGVVKILEQNVFSLDRTNCPTQMTKYCIVHLGHLL